MWVLHGLRNGVLTTRWPARPDEYAASTRGPATMLSGAAAAADEGASLSGLCPAGAISQDDRGAQLDQGHCIQCGWCVAARPDVFGWQRGPGSAALARAGPPRARRQRDTRAAG